jgi:phage shock protein C
MAKKLYRSRTDRMIAGVCGGLAEYFNIDSTLVRLAAVALTLAGGSGVLAYLIFWFVVPQRPLDMSASEKPPTSSDAKEHPVDKEETEAGTAALFVGVLLTVLGFLFLVGNFISFAWLSFSKLWPLVLIAIGILIVMKGTGRRQNAS